MAKNLHDTPVFMCGNGRAIVVDTINGSTSDLDEDRQSNPAGLVCARRDLLGENAKNSMMEIQARKRDREKREKNREKERERERLEVKSLRESERYALKHRRSGESEARRVVARAGCRSI